MPASKRSSKRKTVQITLWVKPQVRAELERIAKTDHLTLSGVGSAFLEQAVRQSLHQQYEALYQPILEQTITRLMRRRDHLQVRGLFDAAHTRQLVTNILSNLPGMTPERFTHILKQTEKSARHNMLKRTPPIEAMLEEVKQMLAQEDKEKKEVPHTN